MAIAATAPSTKTTTSWYFFLALPVIIGYMHSSPNVVYFGGYMLACLYARSVVRTRTLLLMESPFLSLPLLRSAFVPFFILTHFSASLPSSKLLECKIRLHAYVCVYGEVSKRTERKERKKYDVFSYSLALSPSLVFSFSPNTTYEAGICRLFLTRSRIYSQASTTTTIESYVFSFVSLLSFLFAWSSSSNMRFICYHRSCSWCCYHYSTNNVIYLSIYTYNNTRLHTLFSHFDFPIVSNRRYKYIYIYNLGLCCLVVVVFF